MFGENQFLCAAIEDFRAIGLIAGRPGWIPAACIPLIILCTCILFCFLFFFC
jgi:hypothetical protein